MVYSVPALERAAVLIEAWGQTRMPLGRTLADALTIDGLSWWDVAAPNLAVYYLAPYLGEGFRPSLRQRVRPLVGRLRQKANGLRRARHGAEDCNRWPAGHPVCLFLGFSPYVYRDVVRSLVDYVGVDGRLRPVSVFGGTSLFDNPRAATLGGQPHWHDIYKHWTDDVRDLKRAIDSSLSQAADALRSSEGLPAIARDEHLDLWPQTRPLFEWLLRVYYPALTAHAAAASHLLGVHRPAVVVSADVNDARNRIYLLLCRRLGIPTVELQFGMAAAEAVEWRFFLADHLAVWGEQSRQVMLTHGVPEARIRVTGSPRYDEFARRVAGDGAGHARAQGRRAKRRVLFASVHSGLLDKTKLAAVKRAIFRSVPPGGDVELLVKPHPGETPGETESLARGLPHVTFADARDDIRTLIPDCDGFLTLGSTATMDALLANKPVAYAALSGLAWWPDQFRDSGAVLIARSEDELGSFFRSLADGSIEATQRELEPAKRRFLKQWLYRADGRASERIANLLADAVGHHGRGIDEHAATTAARPDRNEP